MASLHTPRYGFLLACAVSLIALRWLHPMIDDVTISHLIVLSVTGFAVAILLTRTRVRWLGIAIVVGIMLSGARVLLLKQNPTLKNPGATTITGWVSDYPERFPTMTRYTVRLLKPIERGIETILVSDFAGWPRYFIGDPITAQGSVEMPEPLEDFDYASYLRSQGIDGLMKRARISGWETTEKTPVRIRYSPLKFLEPLKDGVETLVRRISPEPHASLLIGLLTGSDTGISKELKEAFRVSGLSHILAVSGFNVTITLSLLGSFLFWVPIQRRVWLLASGAIMFCLLVGADAPVVRATIMGILGLIGISAERPTHPRIMILITFVCMSLWNPLWLWFDPGFALSFAATVGIAEMGPGLRKRIPLPHVLAIRESLATTLAAQIATLPISIILFRSISLIAPITNIFVAPVIPLAMLFGSIAGLLGGLVQEIGLLAAYPAWMALEWILLVATKGAALPFASIGF